MGNVIENEPYIFYGFYGFHPHYRMTEKRFKECKKFYKLFKASNYEPCNGHISRYWTNKRCDIMVFRDDNTYEGELYDE